ncbi:trypsin-like serine protease [Sorangium sp. So ce117]|uniref:trypsin-like serine protease n=1 Tax=Sorangium sp. So ce117 TaxID=3133277 RepID=UPI003F6240EF
MAVLTSACGSPGTEECTVVAVSSALVGGVEHTGYLGLSGQQTGAVVAVELNPGEDGSAANLCTGVMLSEESLITAAHCLWMGTARLKIAAADWQRDVVAQGQEIALHPSRDVAMIKIAGLGAPSWLPRARGSASDRAGHLVEVAGAGLREDGGAGTVEFAVARIASATEDHLIAQMSGGGLCGGDSGGPLLRRGPSGAVEVLGVLSQGAPSCAGPDRYERLDNLVGWLDAMVGAPSSSESACETLGTRGRCFGSTAVWCQSGVESAASCEGESACGWDPAQRGFRCVSASSDPCRGITDLGRCDGESAQRCVDGVVEELSCPACGSTCTISSRSGKATCS